MEPTARVRCETAVPIAGPFGSAAQAPKPVRTAPNVMYGRGLGPAADSSLFSNTNCCKSCFVPRRPRSSTPVAAIAGRCFIRGSAVRQRWHRRTEAATSLTRPFEFADAASNILTGRHATDYPAITLPLSTWAQSAWSPYRQGLTSGGSDRRYPRLRRRLQLLQYVSPLLQTELQAGPRL